MTDENLQKRLNLVKQNTILEVVHGSRAYGTNTPESDTDIKGICIIPDLKYYTGMQTFEQQDGGWVDAQGNKQDKVVYHLPKFLKLAGDCNPNILEILFADQGDILVCTKQGKKLLENRHLFVSKKARHTFTGYAAAQLKRMSAHYRWTSNPPQKPEYAAAKHVKTTPIGPLGTHLAQSGFLKQVRLADPRTFKEKFLAFFGLATRDQEWFDLDIEVIDKGSYEAAKREWDNYEKWKKNRNEKRSELERRYGLDLKHAYHLVRLLRMGLEIVRDGQVIVKRPDKDELLHIRNGGWTYEQILAYADEMENKIIEAEKTSTLPWSPDWKAIEELQMELIQDALVDSGQIGVG